MFILANEFDKNIISAELTHDPSKLAIAEESSNALKIINVNGGALARPVVEFQFLIKDVQPCPTRDVIAVTGKGNGILAFCYFMKPGMEIKKITNLGNAELRVRWINSKTCFVITDHGLIVFENEEFKGAMNFVDVNREQMVDFDIFESSVATETAYLASNKLRKCLAAGPITVGYGSKSFDEVFYYTRENLTAKKIPGGGLAFFAWTRLGEGMTQSLCHSEAGLHLGPRKTFFGRAGVSMAGVEITPDARAVMIEESSYLLTPKLENDLQWWETRAKKDTKIIEDGKRTIFVQNRKITMVLTKKPEIAKMGVGLLRRKRDDVSKVEMIYLTSEGLIHTCTPFQHFSLTAETIVTHNLEKDSERVVFTNLRECLITDGIISYKPVEYLELEAMNARELVQWILAVNKVQLYQKAFSDRQYSDACRNTDFINWTDPSALGPRAIWNYD